LFFEFCTILAPGCNDNGISAMMKQKQMQEFVEKSEKIAGRYPKNVKYFTSNFRFDKRCSYDDRIKSINDSIPCFLRHSQALMLANQLSITNHPKSLSLCKTTEKILKSCFQSNRCFSQQEMNSVRESISTYYAMPMEILAQMSENFGSFSSIVQTVVDLARMINQETTLLSPFMYNDYVQDQKIKKEQDAHMEMAVEIFVLAIVDYNSGNCKTVLEQSSASRQLPTIFTIVSFMVLSLIFIKKLKISG
jgi:hypothetical protein